MIIVGTTNKRKCEVVKKLFHKYSKTPQEVVPFKADSKVPQTPWNKETYTGARNRAVHAKNARPDCDFAVGLESGLIKRYGHIYEEAWACLITKDNTEYFGYSSGLKVPDIITEKMEKQGLEHYEVMDLLDQEAKRINNDDTWGTYSEKLLIRDVSLGEALRNALVQLFAPEGSYYKS